MYDKELDTKENIFEPRITLTYNRYFLEEHMGNF